MTEEEARTKWCPYRRTIQQIGNAIYVTNKNATCIASECMAWRTLDNTEKWHETKVYNKTQDGPKEYVHTLNEPFGYCGLAGKP